MPQPTLQSKYYTNSSTACCIRVLFQTFHLYSTTTACCHKYVTRFNRFLICQTAIQQAACTTTNTQPRASFFYAPSGVRTGNIRLSVTPS